MTENGTPIDRAESRMAKADAAIDAKALGALAADMASIPSHVVPPCSCENTDAALGLEDAEPFDEMTGPHDGRTPGTTTPCRMDAASLSDWQARRRACRVVESAAHVALLGSGLTAEQIVLVSAYNDAIHETRKADLEVHFALWANGGAA